MRTAAATTSGTRSRGRTSLGSVYAKTLRDSRLATFLAALTVALFVFAGGVTMATTYGTAAARQELAMMSSGLPEFLRGLYGNPDRVDTLGGFVTWHYGAYLALLMGLWSILALSATLAGEARRGSLEFVVATPHSRARIAAEKVLAHLTSLAAVAVVAALVAWLTGLVGAMFPGDEIEPVPAVAFGVGIVARAAFVGALAFALSSFMGRGAAAGLAGAVMVGGYVLQGYRGVVGLFDDLAPLNWFSWSAGHMPLAGQTDWPGLALTMAATAAFVLGGVVIFVRRDVGAGTAVTAPAWPSFLIGIGGPVRRMLGDLLPAAVAWGVGLAAYGLLMAASARAFADALAGAPELAAMIRRLMPSPDLTTTEGYLQFAFADLGYLLMGLAATTLVAAWAGEETSGRLEIPIVSPLTRQRWLASCATAIWLALAVVTVLLATAVAAGVVVSEGDSLSSFSGTLVLGIYGVAVAGVGIAVGGLVRPSLGAPAAFAFAVGTFLCDVLAPILGLPDWVEQLALTEHLGRPLIGEWDPVGVGLCLALVVLGTIVGAWGLNRRDLTG